MARSWHGQHVTYHDIMIMYDRHGMIMPWLPWCRARYRLHRGTGCSEEPAPPKPAPVPALWVEFGRWAVKNPWINQVKSFSCFVKGQFNSSSAHWLPPELKTMSSGHPWWINLNSVHVSSCVVLILLFSSRTVSKAAIQVQYLKKVRLNLGEFLVWSTMWSMV